MTQQLEFVTVGDPGNANGLSALGGNGYGSVGYTYQIGKYEVTYGQWAEFLNAKAKSDPTGLYNQSMITDKVGNGLSRSGTPGSYTYAPLDAQSADKPVNYVAFQDIVRYANWVNNGKASSDTESGAYKITQGTLKMAARKDQVITFTANGILDVNEGDQIEVSGFKGQGFNSKTIIETIDTVNGNTVFTVYNNYPNARATGKAKIQVISGSHSADAKVWIPTENEWLKAAYYDPTLDGGEGDYWKWATRSNDLPGNISGTRANQANIPNYVNGIATFANGVVATRNIRPSTGPNLLTTVGSFAASPSYYGTFDQDGNVEEWTSTIYDPTAPLGTWNSSFNSFRARHGAPFYNYVPGSEARDDDLVPSPLAYGMGFRLAAAPGYSDTSSTARLQSAGSANAASALASLSKANTKKYPASWARFGGTLSPSEEIWSVDYPASGSSKMWLDPKHTHLDYKIKITGLDLGLVALGFPLTPDEGDDLYGLHIHYGPKGTAGPVALGIANPNNDLNTKYSYNKRTNTWTVSGRWSANDPSVVDFNFNLANYLKEGYNYVNAHNDAVPLGVIEGRFEPLNAAAVAFVNAPATPATSYLIKSPKLQHVDSHGHQVGHKSHQGSDALTGQAINDDSCLDSRLDGFSHANMSDRLVDYDETQDRLDLRNCDGNSILPGIQEFTFVGDDVFAKNTPGQLRYSNGVLMAELNGDLIPDFEHQLLGAPVLTADSFLL
jgi:formylglycine-generating enzyme